MGKVICVYSSSSSKVGENFFRSAEALGREIAERGHTFLFGGGMRGLMGASATAAHKYGGKVIGIIPKALNQKGIVYELCDELRETPGIRERKAMMDERSDAFIALPGGYGTLEELLEVISLKLLGYHGKPIVIMNADGFYDSLLRQFDQIIGMNFAHDESKRLYMVTDDAGEALDHIENYKPSSFMDKWL